MALVLLACAAAWGCRGGEGELTASVQPRALRDVPAARLSFRFEPDVNKESLPAELTKEDDPVEPPAAIRDDFKRRRPDDALVRVVLSPEGQRALVLYGTGETNNVDFRIDLYSAEGIFLRDVLPPNIVGRYDEEVAWSPDGQQIAFIGIRNPNFNPSPTPTPADAAPPAVDVAPAASPGGDPSAAATPAPAPSVAPIIPSAQVFSTEQLYVADRDGFQIKPLTTRDGLIYFDLAWAPDGHAIAALACKEQELYGRLNQGLAPAGRPRVVALDAQERLLDDRLAEAPLVWSPDASKVATAFDTDVAVYDAAAGVAPTAAGIPLREPLLTSSAEYDANVLKKGTSASPLSFNPVVRLSWAEPETLYVQTAFVRYFSNAPPVRDYPRWHVLRLSSQAAVVG